MINKKKLIKELKALDVYLKKRGLKNIENKILMTIMADEIGSKMESLKTIAAINAMNDKENKDAKTTKSK